MKSKPIRVLWTGASFVTCNDLPALTTDIINAGPSGVTAEYVDVSKGGTPLKWQIDNADLLKTIQDGRFDYVVCNEIVLGIAVTDATRCDDAKRHIAAIVEAAKRSGAAPVFLCTWLQNKDMRHFETYVQHYIGLVQKHGGALAPVGHAWQAAWQLRTEGDLGLYGPDMNHPSFNGTHLAASVLYSVFTGQSPEGITLGKEDDKRDFLHNVAWRTFQRLREQGAPIVCVLDIP